MQQIKLTDSYLEGQLIQALLAQPDKVVQYIEELSPSHFADPVYRDIFDAIHLCIMSSLRPDIIQVSQVIASATRDKARKNAAIDAVRSSIGTSIPTGVPALISRLNALRLGRDIHEVIAEAGEMLHDLNPGTLDRLTDRVMSLNLKQGGGESVSEPESYVDKSLAALNEAIEAAKSGVLPPTVVYTGFPHFDKVCGGLRSGEVVSIGASSGVGKSTISRQIAINAALEGHPVLFYSGEMSDTQSGILLACALAGIKVGEEYQKPGVSNTEIFTGVIYKSPELHKRYLEASELLRSLPIIIVHNCREFSTLMGYYKRWRIKIANHAKKTGSTKRPLFLLDYLALPEDSSFRGQRNEMLKSISSRFKQTCIADDVLGIACSQLNRERLKRGSGIPRLGDGAETAGLENDSTIVIYLHNPCENGNEVDADGNWIDAEHERHAYVVKARFGGLGKVKLWMDPPSGKVMQMEDAVRAGLYNPLPPTSSAAFMGGGNGYG